MTSRPAFVLEDGRRGELLEVVYLSPEELTPYEGNARKHDIKDVEQIKESIRLDGFNDPIGIWGENNIIVEGHGRQIAALEMGLDKVPCIRLDHLTDAQRRDYAIRHNRTAELSTWDWQILEDELQTLESEGFDTGELFEDCFDAIEESYREEKEKYSREVKIPHYEPKDEDVCVPELFDDTKYKELMQEIAEAKNELSEEEFYFLMLAAYRHIVFDFDKIADYYAKASKKVQELMEHSALVIIDYNDAIANGYAILSEALEDMMEQDNA